MVANDWDHRIIDAVSVALQGKIGSQDDVDRLMVQVTQGGGENKLKVACEIAVAFIRWSQDLKEQRESLKEQLEALQKSQVLQHS